MLRIVEDRVFFKTKFGIYTGKIRCASNELFYFQDDSGCNYQSLYDAGFKSSITRETLFEKILGYYPETGAWPWCKTREDVIKVLRYLTREDRKNFIQLNNIV